MTTQQSRVHKKMVALARSRKPVIEVRNKNYVVSVNSSGRIVAEAKRHHVWADWQVLALVESIDPETTMCNAPARSDTLEMKYVAKVSHGLDEVRQRKAVLVLLEAVS